MEELVKAKLCITVALALLLHSQHLQVEAFGRGYERLLGGKSVNKYCGEEGQDCMFANQCCDGYSCEFQEDFGYSSNGRCTLQSEGPSYGRTGGLGDSQQLDALGDATACHSNLDCSYDECCQPNPAAAAASFFLLRGNAKTPAPAQNVCSKSCHQTTRTRQQPAIVGNYHNNGNNQYQSWWQKWQRRAV